MGTKYAIGILFLTLAIFFGFTQDANKKFVIETKKIPELRAHTHPPGEPDGPHGTWFYSEIVSVPEDMWVERISVKVNNAPKEILHHLLLWELNRPGKICPDTLGKYTTELYSVSRNSITEPLRFEAPYAVFLKKGATLAVEVMEHTTELPDGPGGAYKDVSVSVIMDIDKSGRHKKPLEFYRLRLDDSPCAWPYTHEAFTVPAGAQGFVRAGDNTQDDSSRFVFDEDGVIVGLGANMWPWKGAEWVSGFLNGRNIVTLTAKKGAKPGAWNIPYSEDNISVKAGDIIEVRTSYSNPFLDKPIKDASGMLGFYFAPGIESPE